MPSQPIKLTDNQRSAVAKFIASPKFTADADYVGFLSADVVLDPDAELNALARRTLADQLLSKERFLNDAIATLKPFELADTEDRERAFAQVELLMTCIGIDSSDGSLTKALYGFDLNSTEAK